MAGGAFQKFKKEKIQPYLGQFDAVSARERAFIFVAVISIIGFVWHTFLYLEASSARETVKKKIEQTKKSLDDLGVQIEKIKDGPMEDPSEAVRRERDALQQRLALTQEKINEFSVEHISPTQMVRVLEQLLNRETDLVLVRMENEPAEPVVKAFKDKVGPKSARENMYRHGVLMEFRGDYMSTLRYLQMMEDLSWKFVWDDLQYRVEEYPEALITVRFHTLSGEESVLNIENNG